MRFAALYSNATQRLDKAAQFIYCDRDGIVWAGNSTNPLNQYNPIYPSAMRYAEDTANPSALSHNHVSSMVRGPHKATMDRHMDGMDIFDPVTVCFKPYGKKICLVSLEKILFQWWWIPSNKKSWIKAWSPDAMYEMDIRNKQCRKLTIHDTTFDHRLSWDIESEVVQPFQKGIIFPIEGEGIFSISKDSLVAYQQLSISQFIARMVLADNRLLFLKLSNTQRNLTYTYQPSAMAVDTQPPR
jgi:hypothetical protein